VRYAELLLTWMDPQLIDIVTFQSSDTSLNNGSVEGVGYGMTYRLPKATATWAQRGSQSDGRGRCWLGEGIATSVRDTSRSAEPTSLPDGARTCCLPIHQQRFPEGVTAGSRRSKAGSHWRPIHEWVRSESSSISGTAG
jgi:hypothetical protein